MIQPTNKKGFPIGGVRMWTGEQIDTFSAPANLPPAMTHFHGLGCCGRCGQGGDEPGVGVPGSSRGGAGGSGAGNDFSLNTDMIFWAIVGVGALLFLKKK